VSKLPTDLSGRQLRRALERVGFVFQRQKGSHMILRRENPHARVVIPDHKTLRLGTLRSILVEANISPEELKELL
jgi:predicted RNA binding protein YcfA (HicA-like mRNA interferase family)